MFRVDENKLTHQTFAQRQCRLPIIMHLVFFCKSQELHTNQEAVLSGFDDEGISAIVIFTSSMESASSNVENVPGSMKTWLVRGMVRYCLCESSMSIGDGTVVENTSRVLIIQKHMSYLSLFRIPSRAQF